MKSWGKSGDEAMQYPQFMHHTIEMCVVVGSALYVM